MAKWKLSRQSYGSEEFILKEGDEVTVGRGVNNTIVLSSIVISRNHCVLSVAKDKLLITDLKSSNGVYVGKKKIPQNSPYTLNDSDLIGFGWTIGAPLVNISDNEKFVFLLTKENKEISISNKIGFESENEFENIEKKIALLDSKVPDSEVKKPSSPTFNTKKCLKRKLNNDNVVNEFKKEIKEEVKRSRIITIDDDVINITDSDNEINFKQKKVIPTFETISEEPQKVKEEEFEFEAFNIKQEYLGYDDPIPIDSDSDSESEHWLLRLSQSSPGKPFVKVMKKSMKQEDSSYSQLDDFIDENLLINDESENVEEVENNEEAENNQVVENNEKAEINDEEFMYDIISIPPQPPDTSDNHKTSPKNNDSLQDIRCKIQSKLDREEFMPDTISRIKLLSPKHNETEHTAINRDEIDGIGSDKLSKNLVKDASPATVTENNVVRKAQMIEPLNESFQKRVKPVKESKSKSSSKHSKVKKHSSSKKLITNSQKEERKKRLKDIATKGKDECEQATDQLNDSNLSKCSINVKVTSSNRGAFLTDAVQVVKPMKRKESPKKSKRDKDRSTEKAVQDKKERTCDIENKIKQHERSNRDEDQTSRRKSKEKSDSSKSKTVHSEKQSKSHSSESRVPLKSLKPLSECEESFSRKPISKVEPMPSEKRTKPKKQVRFSDAGPSVHIFQIEPGNKMKKTSLVKTTLVDVQQMPVFSLEKITLMKILRWNPHWLEEQKNNNEPPPILGHSNPPMTVFHTFNSHNQYVQLIGDLLLMEIWECISLSYMKSPNPPKFMQMRIESLPPVPTQERSFELFSLSVNISVPTSEAKSVPRNGDILIGTFGPENARNNRFFFVHNVRCLPSPPNNIYSFFSISLHATYTDKMKLLRPGEIIFGRSLAYINKELMLFEAMEYLARSPLSEAILRPEPRNFFRYEPLPIIKSQWTMALNPSQHAAVSSSVAAALGDRPCIQMVQGPPGTGKSSVICAMIMSYFYDSSGKRHQNRGKILICATSNAAVDELIIRLLNIRQSLPKAERFRMVRVGRVEAMHPRAYDVSSQQLAQRDATRLHSDQNAHPGVNEEISRLEAKVNMWRTAAQDAKDPVRVAYCQGRVTQLLSRITLLRNTGSGGGGGEEVRSEQLALAERRIIEGADIIVTTLASAANPKMRGLKRRIALCIVDEAGQAIEPETLIPLTLDVTKLTLIGDPQQLPGFICSQRAKKHGLGESLFLRLTSCAEQWPEGNPVVLLNQQYRMHPEIADYPNRAFYDGRIQTGTPARPDINIPPYTILSISSGDKGQGHSGANEMEAWGVSRLSVALAAYLRPRGLQLTVITPYNAHKDLIRKYTRMLQEPTDPPVEVNTVDSFQGQERDVVIVSLARSQGVGFLTDAGRMNVMLTRAKHALLICLNPHAMLKNHQWRTLVEDAQRRHLYKVLPNKMCKHIAAGTPADGDILQYVTYQTPNTSSRR